MFSSNSIKIFSGLTFALLVFSSCGWQTAKTETPTTDFTAGAIKPEIPFPTKEPEMYQAKIFITNFINGEKTEKKTFIARRGEKRLTIYNLGEKTEQAVTKLGTGHYYFSYTEKKIFDEAFTTASIFPEPEETLNDFLTNEWLNQKTSAGFENAETENNLTKFRARLDDAKNSEIVIYVDENLKMPVRQEFYAVADGQKNLAYSVELKDIRLEADEKLFDAPENFRKVPQKEFQEILRRVQMEK